MATAALIAVPLPLSMPVIVVDSVMAGVEVAVATVPAKPLADTTETVVTVPLPVETLVAEYHCVVDEALNSMYPVVGIDIATLISCASMYPPTSG